MRLINLWDGALLKTNPVTSLFVLLYVSTVGQFGTYLSFISLVMAGVSWLVAKTSDKTNRRMRYLWPATLLAGGAVAAFVGVSTFSVFVVCMILLRSALVIAEPIRSNIMQDTIPPNDLNWISRELYLNLGRTILLFSAAGLFILGMPKGVFILFGVLHIAFPFVVRAKKIYI